MSLLSKIRKDVRLLLGITDLEEMVSILRERINTLTYLLKTLATLDLSLSFL